MTKIKQKFALKNLQIERKKEKRKPIKLKKRVNNNKILGNWSLPNTSKFNLFMQSFQIHASKHLATIFEGFKF